VKNLFKKRTRKSSKLQQEPMTKKTEKFSLKQAFKLSIRKKLIGGFIIVAMLFGIVSGVSYFMFWETEKSYSTLIDETAAVTLNFNEMYSISLQQVNYIQTYLLTQDPTYEHMVRESNMELERTINATKELTADQAIHTELDEINGTIKEFRKKYNELFILSRGKSDFNWTVETYNKEVLPISLQLQERFKLIASSQMERMETMNKGTQDAIGWTMNFILYLTIGAVIAAIIIGFIISGLISRPIIRMKEYALELSSGNLTLKDLKVKSKDELGELASSFTLMANNLRELISQVGLSAEQVSASSAQLTASINQTSVASEEIAMAIQQVAIGAENQTKGTVESAMSLEEMSIGIQRIAETISVTSELTENINLQADLGGQAIRRSKEQMKSIEKSVLESDQNIRELGKYSTEIGNISKVITEIAEQTNLLALNAAIEAARAGEFGRGFSVVAGEVRKLAEQSAQSAKQISELINSIRVGTQKSVNSMDKVKGEVQGGIQIADETDTKFKGILEAVALMSHQIQEITATSEQMSAGTQQITATVSEVANVSKEQAAKSEEVASAAEVQMATVQEMASSAEILSQLSEELKAQIKKFSIQ